MSDESRTPGPFFFPGGPVGILMLHGFTGSAYIFESLAASLSELGYTAYACLLSGHGTTPEDMEKTTTEDWIASAAEAYDKLRESCDTIYVIGASFGGLIGASLSLRRKVAGIIMVGTPLALEHQRLMTLAAAVLPLLGRRFYQKGSTRVGVKYYEKAGNDLGSGNSVFAGGNHSYRRMPIASVRQLLRYLRVVCREVLPKVTAPVLAIQSREDGLVTAGSGEKLMEVLGSSQKRLFWTQRPHHKLRELLADPEVYHEILDSLSPA